MKGGTEMRKPATKPAHAAHAGTIRAEDIYTLAEFQRRTGLKEWALRQARRSGLKVIYLHGRGFLRGSDWLDYLSKAADAAQTDSQAR